MHSAFFHHSCMRLFFTGRKFVTVTHSQFWTWTSRRKKVCERGGEIKREEAKEKGRSMKECLLLLLIDPARLFITPWTPASVSYITAKPPLTDGREWGEKNGSEILLDALGGNKGGAVMDGCVWPRRGGRQRWVSSRWDREPAEPLPLCPERPSLVRMRGISLSCLRQCFYHPCQNRRSPYSTDKTGPHVTGIQIHPLSLWQAWCQHGGRYFPTSL